MSDSDNELFEQWCDAEGHAIAAEIRESMKINSDLLSIDEGSHATWHEGDLGMLIVLPFEHVMAFAAESVTGDFYHSPVHNYVFATITELITRATDVMAYDDEDEDWI